MTRFIAFLRAINVGGHVVKMDTLRGQFESMGFSDVTTFIASGNVIFNSASRSSNALERKIEVQLHKALGYAVDTFIRTSQEVVDIASYKPFAETDLNAEGVLLYVGFMADALSSEALAKLMAFRSAVDDFHVHNREVYWLCRIRSSDSEFSLARFEKVLGVRATFRNITTVRRIALLMK